MIDLDVLRERLMRYVYMEPMSGCWLWTAWVGTKGYGELFHSGVLKERRAHRLSWIAHKGLIPPGMLVCHRCDVRSCINPSHLFLGTHADNAKDRDAKGRTRVVVGERQGHARLTGDQVLAIRQLTREGNMMQIDIAARFGVSTSCVRSILTRVNWKHLP